MSSEGSIRKCKFVDLKKWLLENQPHFSFVFIVVKGKSLEEVRDLFVERKNAIFQAVFQNHDVVALFRTREEVRPEILDCAVFYDEVADDQVCRLIKIERSLLVEMPGFVCPDRSVKEKKRDIITIKQILVNFDLAQISQSSSCEELKERVQVLKGLLEKGLFQEARVAIKVWKGNGKVKELAARVILDMIRDYEMQIRLNEK